MQSDPVWPKGIQCPVVLSFDLDAELLWKVWMNGEPSLIDKSQGVYGPKVGLPRVLRMLKRHKIKGTFFVPGWVAEKYPEEVRQIAQEGHEVAHHGYLHEDCSKLSLEQEREMLVRGRDVLQRVTGKRPRGFRLMPSKNTFKLLAQLDFAYDSVLMDSDTPSESRLTADRAS